MKKHLKALCAVMSVFIAMSLISFNVSAANIGDEEIKRASLELDCKSSVLMEAETGQILYSNNENEPLPPASVTKVMTLLLIMEAIEDNKLSYTDIITASEHACSMGGSQIYLEPGEKMSVEDLLKSVIIASANDAAVTLAEHVAGTEEAFVEQMNLKAAELGMNNTHFENTNGLDDTTENHVTSALDIAIMSRELIKYPKITEYSSIWMDSVRNGEFGLTNTNRLIRYYKGANGLKTGSTTKAGFCITATAERDGMTLIAVIMGAPSRDIRNAAAVSLLNFGFSNFALFKNNVDTVYTVDVVKGKKNNCTAKEQPIVAVIEKKYLGKLEKKIELNEKINAPVKIGEKVGTVTYYFEEMTVGSADVLSAETVKSVSFFDVFFRILAKISLK